MEIFQPEENDVESFDVQTPVYKIRKIGIHSVFGLYLSKTLLFFGFLLVLLNSLDILEPGSYFGESNWITTTVYSVGLMITFIFIPWLYFSSFRNFKKDIDYWDKEMFWILPLFIFGTYSLYCEQMDPALVIFEASIAVIAAVHLIFVFLAWRLMKKRLKGSLANHHYQYLITLKYLTAYYVILIALLIFYNPLQYVFTWIRLNI